MVDFVFAGQVDNHKETELAAAAAAAFALPVESLLLPADKMQISMFDQKKELERENERERGRKETFAATTMYA